MTSPDTREALRRLHERAEAFNPPGSPYRGTPDAATYGRGLIFPGAYSLDHEIGQNIEGCDGCAAWADAERAAREGERIANETLCALKCGHPGAHDMTPAPSGCCGLHDHTPAERAPVAPHPDESHEFRTACLRCGEPGNLFVSVLAPGETMTLNPAPAALAPATLADRVEAPRD